MKFFGKYREKYDVYLIKPFCSVKVRKKDLLKKKNFFYKLRENVKIEMLSG